MKLNQELKKLSSKERKLKDPLKNSGRDWKGIATLVQSVFNKADSGSAMSQGKIIFFISLKNLI